MRYFVCLLILFSCTCVFAQSTGSDINEVKDRVIWHDIVDKIEYNKSLKRNEVVGTEVLFMFRKEDPISLPKNEVFRNEIANTIELKPGYYRSTIYSKYTFHKEGNSWYDVGYGVATEKEFKKATGNLFSRIFGIQKAYAVGFNPNAGGDGFCVETSGVWDTVRNSAGGGHNDTNTTYNILNQLFQGTYAITRIFVPFNTGSVLTNDATIDSASLAFVLTTKNNFHVITNEWVITESSQVDPTNLATADYNNITLNSPPEGGARMPLAVFPSLIQSQLNSTGIGWVKRAGELSNNGTSLGWTLICMRGNKDVDNVAPTFIDINCVAISADLFIFKPTLTVEWHAAMIQSGTIEEGTIEE